VTADEFVACLLSVPRLARYHPAAGRNDRDRFLVVCVNKPTRTTNAASTQDCIAFDKLAYT